MPLIPLCETPTTWRCIALCTFAIAVTMAAVGQAQAPWKQEFDAIRKTVQEQQQVIEQQGRQLDSQQQRLDEGGGASHSGGYAGENTLVEYNGGFVFSSHLGGHHSDDSHKLRIGTWGQLRHNYFDSDGPNLDQNDFDIERLRVVFDGHAFNPDFRYFFQLDADSDAGEVVDMLDYYLTYDFGHDLLCWDKGRLALRFGKWKIGFNRAREESGTKMQFSDRSSASVLFDFDRSLGVGLLGELGPFDWQAAIANGIDTGGYRPSRSTQLDRNLAVATRVNWLLAGDWGMDGHADLDWRCAPAIRLGAGFTFSRRDTEGVREFAFPRVVDSGTPINTVLPAGVTAYDQFMYAADLNVKYRGFSFVFEYYARQFAAFKGAAVSDLRDHGYWAEAGYFVVPQRLQFIARHARIVGNSGTLGLVDQSSDEVAGGVVVYFRKHNLKLTFDATHLNGVPVSDSALNMRPGDAGWLYRTQFQWKF